MKPKLLTLPALALVAAVLAGCAPDPAITEGASTSPSQSQAEETPTPTPTPTRTPAVDLATIRDAVKAGVPEIGEVIELTEDNDPNDLIGRPNGYIGGAVFYDGRVSCDELSVECGATLEEWPDKEGAQGRSDYIQGILTDTPALGSEYHYVVGAFLLRVSGDLKPLEAEAYESSVAPLIG